MSENSNVILPGGMTPQQIAAAGARAQERAAMIDFEGRMNMAQVMATIAAPLVAMEVQVAIQESAARAIPSDSDDDVYAYPNFARAVDQAEIAAIEVMRRTGFNFKRDEPQPPDGEQTAVDEE